MSARVHSYTLIAAAHLVDLMKTKYSKFIVPKILQYGLACFFYLHVTDEPLSRTKEQRDIVIASFHGHVRQLIRHKVSATMLH